MNRLSLRLAVGSTVFCSLLPTENALASCMYPAACYEVSGSVEQCSEIRRDDEAFLQFGLGYRVVRPIPCSGETRAPIGSELQDRQKYLESIKHFYVGERHKQTCELIGKGPRFYAAVEENCCDTVPSTGSCALDGPLLTPIPAESIPQCCSELWVERMEKLQTRLPPDAFPQLPSPIQKDLSARGCTIPQDRFVEERSNVIRGNFQEAGRSDWAVLCSIGKQSRILIYKGGSNTDVYELPGSIKPDRDWFHPTFVFTRLIESADAETIHSYDHLGGPKPPPIDHDGIHEIGEKGSKIFYWHKDDWLVLQGSD